MIHLYCGDGKGKTTAAMGLAMRSAGRGNRVVVAQFLKNADSGERAALSLLPSILLLDAPEIMKFVFQMTPEEKKAWIATQAGVTVGSDAFFPFGDNVERARKSGVTYIAEPGGSIRDDHVIATADKYGMVLAFTGARLFHH